MLKRAFLAVVVVAASAAAVAQTTTAGKPDIEKMFGKRGETPGFYAWPDCAADCHAHDGRRDDSEVAGPRRHDARALRWFSADAAW